MPQRPSSSGSVKDSRQGSKATHAPSHLEGDHGGLLTILREWSDALVFAFVIAMFVRVFVVELFKIPTGSMSPTLLGDWVAYVDWDRDERLDIVVNGNSTRIFLNRRDEQTGREWYELTQGTVPTRTIEEWRKEGILKPQYDRILVNKFSYWTGPPARGDVVVFKVPESIWGDGSKPIYIKRVAGRPGDTISLNGRLRSDGKLIEEPAFFQHQDYNNAVDTHSQGFEELEYVTYGRLDRGSASIQEVRVPEHGVFVLGDNTNSSLDSRYWGVVPLDNLKGKAFVRYWPLSKMKFIR